MLILLLLHISYQLPFALLLHCLTSLIGCGRFFNLRSKKLFRWKNSTVFDRLNCIKVFPPHGPNVFSPQVTFCSKLQSLFTRWSITMTCSNRVYLEISSWRLTRDVPCTPVSGASKQANSFDYNLLYYLVANLPTII